jgi:DNA-binding CsgD family transcriptional regulator
MLDSAVAPQTVPALAAGGFLAVSRPSERRPFPVMVTPLLGQPDGGSADDAAAVIFISNPDWSGISTAQVLQSLYSLTAAEAELVRLLAEGKSLDEAAEHRGVTMNTARSQLKHVFAKTDTRRQGELVQIVLAGVAAFSEE